MSADQSGELVPVHKYLYELAVVRSHLSVMKFIIALLLHAIEQIHRNNHFSRYFGGISHR